MDRTIVVPTKNRLEILRGWIETVDNVLVLDHGSTDGTAKFCRERGIAVIRGEGTIVQAVNAAIANVESEYVAIIPDDHYPKTRLPEPWNGISIGRFVRSPEDTPFHYWNHRNGAYATRRGPSWINFGPGTTMPTELFNRYRYDENFKFYCVDMDLSYRLAKASVKIHYTEAKFVHQHRLTFKQWLDLLPGYTEGILQFVDKHPELDTAMGIARARELEGFDIVILQRAVDTLNELNDQYFGDGFGNLYRTDLVNMSFRCIQAFFRATYLRMAVISDRLADEMYDATQSLYDILRDDL